DTTVSGVGRADAPGRWCTEGSLSANGSLSAAAFTVSTTCLIASRVISWLLRTMPSTCSCTSPVTVAVMVTSSVRADAANYIKHAAHVKQACLTCAACTEAAARPFAAHRRIAEG